MNEFDIKEFGDILKDAIAFSIPKEPASVAEAKHGKLQEKQRNPLQLYQQVQNELSKPLQPMNMTTYYFDLGSEKLEEIYPYYHILEDSQVIHKRDRGTKKSKGSQANISDLGKRDYGKVERKIVFSKGVSKTTYYQEYRKNVRGKRSRLKTETFNVVDDNGVVKTYEKTVGTKTSTTYVNTHYHYIENNLEEWIIPMLVSAYGLKRLKNGASDLVEGQYDFWMQEFNI